MAKRIPACLVVDDFPLNASYCRRAQVEALGYRVARGPWARGWRRQRQALFMPAPLLEEFADLVEELGVRGKFSVLPCPAGWGRMDRSVRNLPDRDREALLGIVRRRIAPRFEITPEVLTHTLALDLRTGALLPHTESAWLTRLAADGRQAELRAYLRRAWEVLDNLGFRPRGTTVGGMEDVSGIGGGRSLLAGDCREALAKALLAVQAEFARPAPAMFMYTGSPPTLPPSRATLAPDEVFASRGRTVFELHSIGDDPLLGVLGGRGDARREAARLVSPGLDSGWFVRHAEAGHALVITVHSATLHSRGTGLGLRVLREALRRLRERYGRRLEWMTPLELIARIGVRKAPDGRRLSHP
jgi:hypothetical protein